MAFLPGVSLSIAGAVVAIGGAYPLNPVVRACDPDGGREGPVSRIYSLEAMAIRPIVRGPRQRGAVSYRRVAREIAGELDELQADDGGPLRDCFRWTRWAKPDLAGDVAMRLRVDEWGRVAGTTVVDTPAGGADAGACLARVLDGMVVGFYTPRRTDIEITFRLTPSGQGLPKRRPARPVPRARVTGRGPVCVQQPAVLPVDHIEGRNGGPRAIVVVDDFSKQQDDEERHARYEAALKAWNKNGRRGPAPVKVPDVIGCRTRMRGAPVRADVEAAVAFQRGDFEACYAEAAARGHAAGGDVTLVAFVNRAGQFGMARVRESTTRDPVLDHCLAGALERAHVATGLGGTFGIDLLLHLAPAAARAPATGDAEELAGDAVDEGDGALALDRYRASQAAAPPARRCAVAAGLLQAALTVAPWQEDDRVSAAVDGVREAMRATPRATLATCQKLALPLLAAWVARPFQLGRATHRTDVLSLATDRMQRLLAFDPPLPNAGLLRLLRAEALLISSLWLEAADQFLAAARDGGLPAAWAAEAADSAAWAYARGLIGPGTFRQILDRLRAGPAPEALAREPEIARRLQAALALRKPGPLDPKLPWEVGFNRGSRASTTDRIEALKGLLPDPPVTALQAPDAWTYLRSLRIAGLPDLVCPEVRRLSAASVARTEADRRRLRAFMDACGAEP